ncbi:asparagine synthase-related protein [Arundinibacter roseus]|uniref:asparagine synthase (glutamine-hydrolyzing) n=1 Tax=Arundinibacter roseus TaxID=2070510 RepID=A0A4R4KD28_9BACT|nr:asparagine synthetase B family protein [Arundinibacter roseus]TDB65794.1 asparagine synthetase B family protein [Arundinibacter roseus]
MAIPYFSGIFYFDPAQAPSSFRPIPDSQTQVVEFLNGYVATNVLQSLHISSNLIVLADCRFHERPKLVQKVMGGAMALSDAELVSHAYVQWGDKLSEHFTGEFTFIIWEKDSGKILVSRDRFGFKTFFYEHKPGAYFAFGNRISRLPTFVKSRNPDYVKIREYLLPERSYRSYEDRTFYAHIKAALPAHTFQILRTDFQQHCYWRINPAQYSGIRHEEEYIELFKTYFYNSIRNCTQGYTNIGTHLSGGIDSSSVACVAHEVAGPLSTFYINPDLPSTDESFYVKAVQQKINSRHFAAQPQDTIYESLRTLSRLFDRPEQFPLPSSFQFAAAHQIQQAQCDVVLTGHDGDSVIGHGNQLIGNYLAAGDWPLLRQALDLYAQERDLSYLAPNWLTLPANKRQQTYMQHFLTTELWKLVRQKEFGHFLRSGRAFHTQMGYSYGQFLASFLEKISSRFSFETAHLLTPDFLNHSNASESTQTAKALYTNLSSDYTHQFQAITNKSYIDATEQLHHIGLHFGHRYAHPYFDEQLIELSLAIPEKLKFGDGKGRETIRRALKGILPEEVRTRGHKTSFSEYGLLSLRMLYFQTTELFGRQHVLWEFIDKIKFDACVKFLLNDKIPLNQKSGTYGLVSRALFLGVWLHDLSEP